jgi:serine/threonine protein kinase
MEYRTPESVPSKWQVGDIILNRYEVCDKFEGGGMGIVYLIYHREWNMQLAVKAPRAEFFQTDGQKKDFEREAETWVQLGLHPNIVTCYYVRRLGGVPHLFADYVAGGSLADWIKDGRLYEGDPNTRILRVLDIAIQIARALTFAHENGIVHQDVKPSNVMMTPNGTAKLSDFGLARARSVLERTETRGCHLPGATVWVENAGMLTPEYASPEQFRGDPLTSRSDCWSWALMLLEMMQGERGWVDGRFGPDALSAHYGVELKTDPIARLLTEYLNPDTKARPHDLQNAICALNLIAHSIKPTFSVKEADSLLSTADHLSNRGVSLLELGRHSEALAAFDEAVSIDKKHLEASYNRSLFLWRNAMIATGAEAFWQNVSVGSPLNAKESYLMGFWHLEAGHLEQGVTLLISALSFDTLEHGEQLTAKNAVTSISKSLAVKTHLKGLIGNITAMTFSADYTKIITCGGVWREDESRYLYINLKSWDVEANQCLNNAKGHSEPIHCVIVSRDSQMAITGSADRSVGIWDLKASKCSLLLKGHLGPVNSIATAHDGAVIFSASEDRTIRVWEANSAFRSRVFAEHVGPARAVVTTYNSVFCASSCDISTTIWSVVTGKSLGTLPFGSHSLAISNDDKHMIAASAQRLRLIELVNFRIAQEIEIPCGICSSAALSGDGCWALSVGGDVRLWDLRSGRCQQVVEANAIQAGFLSDGSWWYRTKECIHVRGRFGGFTSPFALCRPSKPTKRGLFAPSRTFSAADLEAEIARKRNGLV